MTCPNCDGFVFVGPDGQYYCPKCGIVFTD